MRAETTLRRRLVAACVLLAVVIGGVFASAAYVAIEAVEHELVDVRLSRAADEFVSALSGGEPVWSRTDLRLAAEPDMPEPMRALGPGLHEIVLAGRELHVLIVEKGGKRLAIIDDITDFERIEDNAFLALWIAFAAGVLLALAIARISVNRIIAPLTELAQAVQHDTLASHPRLLLADDEIGVLARAFDESASQLRDFLARERMFTADVSHELRTPLTVILGAAELLAGRLEDRPELLAVTERIRRASAETAIRVGALLQLARSPGKIERKPVAMRAVVEQEIERCRPLLNGKPVVITFESPEDVCVLAAPELAGVAVGNLLRNACQFTQQGSVRVGLAADGLVVEDTGPGVPEGLRGRLFEPFVRGSDEHSTGSGLGLSIVKRVADHLGWGIRLEKAPQGGSRFTLSFAPLPTP